MNDILIKLAVVFICWISFTVYEMSIDVALIEQKLESLYPVLQENSER